MRTDRKKDLDKYYNDHLKMHIIRRLMLVDTWSEIKGIEGAVWEALSREEKAEQLEKEGGKGRQLPRYAVAVYDTIKGAELLEDGATMQKGLTWFQKYFTDQYYTLLD